MQVFLPSVDERHSSLQVKVTNYQLQVTPYRLKVTSNKLRARLRHVHREVARVAVRQPDALQAVGRGEERRARVPLACGELRAASFGLVGCGMQRETAGRSSVVIGRQ